MGDGSSIQLTVEVATLATDITVPALEHVLKKVVVEETSFIDALTNSTGDVSVVLEPPAVNDNPRPTTAFVLAPVVFGNSTHGRMNETRLRARLFCAVRLLHCPPPFCCQIFYSPV